MVECLKGIYGWNIRVTDKTVTFATSDMKKGIRGNKLGDGYGKAELVERIAQIVTEREAVNEALSRTYYQVENSRMIPVRTFDKYR